MRLARWSSLAILLSAFLIFSPLMAPIMAQQQERILDPANMDFSVDPAEDFYRFANGGWLDRAEIPPDEPAYGVFNEVNDLTQQQLLSLLDEASANEDLREGSDEWKAVRLFEQGIDLEARNSLGIEPIEPTLAWIDEISSLEELHHFLETSRFEGVHGLFTIDVFSDPEDSTVNAAFLMGPQLWLPERDYYVADDPSLEPIREGYIEAMAQLLQYSGYEAMRARSAAERVYDLETQFAEETFTIEQRQDLSLTSVPMSVADLEQAYPLMDWASYMNALGLPPDLDRIIVTESSYIEALDGIISNADLDALKDLLRLQLLWTYRIYLDEDIQEISFNFRSLMLFGLQELPPIEERILQDVNMTLGFALGQLYVAEHFPPEAKAQISEMVDELIAAFRARLEANPWMSDQAKGEALEKLDNVVVKVGYPDEWRSYEGVEIGDSFAASITNALNFEYRRMLDRVGDPVDRMEWWFPPQVVNAFYDPADNSITFPAGILQPPFFSYQADPAVNFGGIGIVIGHELTHGYDLQGSQFDSEGNLNNWWTEEDQVRFSELNQRVVDQYGAIEVLPGLNVNGQLTVTENVADMGGVQIAYDALLIHLERGGMAATVASPVSLPSVLPMATPVGAVLASPVAGADIDALAPQQRFFIAAATIWREKTREEFLETQVRNFPHAPAELRGTIPLQHMDEFHEAFDIQPGDPMYLPPEERIVIW